jgi:hypothetical protein
VAGQHYQNVKVNNLQGCSSQVSGSINIITYQLASIDLITTTNTLGKVGLQGARKKFHEYT